MPKNSLPLKRIHLLILIICCVSCISKSKEKNQVSDGKLTEMIFKHKEYDFGEIPMGKGVSTVFKFLNTGKNPLLIKKVTTTCGCTVPEWPKKIINPNQNGEIKIVYDAKYPGRFNKTITVVYNGKDSPQQLTIKGEIPYPEEEKRPSE